MNASRNKIREASHAGSWYTNDGRALDSQLSQWLSDAKVAGAGGFTTRAIIAPHAGYSYSGSTAAYAYRQIDPSKVNRVFILGPSHHVYLKGCALTTTTRYQTPLYDLTVDRSVTDELHATGHFEWMSLRTDEDEHSIEMHLPYIAKIMNSKIGQYTVVPVLVGSLSKEREIFYGELFAKYLSDPSNLFVISSDFCHWGRRFSYCSYDEKHGTISQHIEHLDRTGMQLIESLNSEGFHSYLQSSKNTICGRHPISVLLRTLDCVRRGDTNSIQMQLKFLHYAQSSKCTSKNESSVSYASAVLSIS